MRQLSELFLITPVVWLQTSATLVFGFLYHETLIVENQDDIWEKNGIELNGSWPL